MWHCKILQFVQIKVGETALKKVKYFHSIYTNSMQITTLTFLFDTMKGVSGISRGARNTGDATTISKSTTGDHYAFLYN